MLKRNANVRPKRRSTSIFVACLLSMMIGTTLSCHFAEAGDAHVAVVLICPRDDLAGCTIATARIFFKIRIESAVPTGCLSLAQAKAAEVSDLWNHETEIPKIACGR